MKFAQPLKTLKFAAVGLAIAAAGAFAVGAYAQHGPGGPGGMDHFGGPAMGHHIGHMVDHMLNVVKATDAQRAQVKQIVQAAAADLKAQHEAHRALHEQAMQLFTQPTVDPVAAESLRQQFMAGHDQASKRMMQAMLDISNVLTPEQRKTLADNMKKHHEMMQRHMRERHELDGQPGR